MTKDTVTLTEQYKLAVASTDKVSNLRAGANKFYVSINSVIAGGLIFYDEKAAKIDGATLLLAIVFGISICAIWLLALFEYSKLNRTKFKLVHQMEEKMPVKFYTDEWALLNEGKWYNKYRNLSRLERLLPLAFVVVYIGLFFALRNPNS